MNASADPRECPYVGLEPFETAYAEFFFGRRQESRVILDHILGRQVAVLYGPSGVGKSSILNVGLPAALPRDDTRQPKWITVILREWQDLDTLEQLAIEAVLKELPERPFRSSNRLRLAPLIAWAIRTTGRPILLILDQFEEYFLYRDRDKMLELEVAMGNLVARRDLPLHILVVLREDSLHQLDQLRAFVPGILETTIELTGLSDAGVEDAIRGPIAVYNQKYRTQGQPILVEDELVATLIRQLKEAETGPGTGRITKIDATRIELPYLQIALTKLWAAEGGPTASALRATTLTDVSKLGGVRQIVRNHLMSVIEKLPVDEQDLCARVFDRLVTGIGSKIAYPTEGLAAPDVVGPGVSQARVEAVLRKLTPKEARILKPVNTSGLRGFEIFHDVLGPPVLEWKRAFQAELRRKSELAQAEEKRKAELAEAEAKRKAELAQVEARRAAEEIARLHAEQQAREHSARAYKEELAKLRAEEEARRQRERADLTVKRRRTFVAITVVTLIAAGAIAMIGWNIYQQRVGSQVATLRTEAARANDFLVREDPNLALLLALEFLPKEVHGHAFEALVYKALQTPRPKAILSAPAAFPTATFSPDGRLLLISRGNAFQVWKVNELELVKEFRPREVTAGRRAVWSADGRWIIGATDDNRTALFAPCSVPALREYFRECVSQNEDEVRIIGESGTASWPSTLSPTGNELLTGGSEQAPQLWDIGSNPAKSTFRFRTVRRTSRSRSISKGTGSRWEAPTDRSGYMRRPIPPKDLLFGRRHAAMQVEKTRRFKSSRWHSTRGKTKATKWFRQRSTAA